MSNPSREQVTEALAQAVREALLRSGETHVPGLGTFHVHHQISQLKEHPDGRIEMHPPRDVVAFTTE